MLKRIFRASLIGILMEMGGGARAQEERPFTVQLDSDFRSRIASSGSSRASLYGNQLDVHAKLPNGWKFAFVGAQNNAPTLTGAGARFNSFITQNAYVERETRANRLQAGIIRLPFGLYDHRETYVSGLIDYPLARVDYALTAVDWGAPGVRWTGNTSNVQVDAAAFGGQGAGVWGNLNNVSGGIVRLQAYTNGVVLGLSRWDGTQSTNLGAAGRQRMHLTGVDMRYTRPHLLLRGEYIFGQEAGDTMKGWYLDAYYHLPKYQKWTLAARIEELKPASGSPNLQQFTLGARYTLDKHWILAANWRNQQGGGYTPSWTPLTGSGGDFFFQLYRKSSF